MIFLPLLMFQFHGIATFCLPVVLLYIAIFRPRIRISYAVTGGILGLVLFLPYIYFDSQMQWENSFALFSFTSDDYHVEAFKVLYWPIVVASNDISRFIGYEFSDFQNYYNRYLGWWPLAIVVMGTSLLFAFSAIALLIKDMVRKLLKWIKERKHDNLLIQERNGFCQSFIFLSVWFFIPTLLFFISGEPYEERYEVFRFPLPFLALALLILKIHRRISDRRVLVSVFTFILILSLSVRLFQMFTYYHHQQYVIEFPQNKVIPSFPMLNALGDALLQKEGSDSQIELIVDADNPNGHELTRIISLYMHYRFGLLIQKGGTLYQVEPYQNGDESQSDFIQSFYGVSLFQR